MALSTSTLCLYVAVNFFISRNFCFSFVLNSLAYITIPKNNGKIKITGNKKLTVTTTYTCISPLFISTQSYGSNFWACEKYCQTVYRLSNSLDRNKKLLSWQMLPSQRVTTCSTLMKVNFYHKWKSRLYCTNFNLLILFPAAISKPNKHQVLKTNLLLIK